MNGASYTYYYDHQMRRRYKGYPTAGVSDEYFYSPRSELLVDQGNDSVSSPTVHPDDEYVWLDGRPVAMVRGQLSTANVRQADSTGACTRNGDGFNCGFYWIVTDPLGKPILMLDSARNIAGVGEYDSYGQVNRVSIDDETVHPYSATQATVLGNYNQSPSPGLTTDLRINFQVIDTRYWAGNQCSYSNNYDWVQLVDGDNTATILGGRYFGNHAKSQWSSWVTPSNGKVQAQFVIGCRPIATSNCGCQSFTPSYTGAVAQSYEYRRHQSATPFWTPLRFPGQYHDEETDANQNWNRFYWPIGGRYLEPEPMLDSPGYAKKSVSGGGTLPTYSYAADNPVDFSDADGLACGDDRDRCSRWYMRAAQSGAGTHVGQPRTCYCHLEIAPIPGSGGSRSCYTKEITPSACGGDECPQEQGFDCGGRCDDAVRDLINNSQNLPTSTDWPADSCTNVVLRYQLKEVGKKCEH